MSFPLRIYAAIWIVVLMFYCFGWSEFSMSMEPELLVFILFTVIVSLVISYFCKNEKYAKIKKPSNKTGIITVVLIACFFLNFLYGGYIPLFGIASGRNEYQSYPGIKGLLPFCISFSMYYYFVLVYHYFSFKKKRYIFEALGIILCFLLMYSRSSILYCILGTVVEWLLLKKNLRSIRFIYVIIAFVLAIIAIWLFGVLGNIRSGYAWNDCSYIEMLGKFKNYPNWLSKQFMWGYLYIITPLANLNYNVAQAHHVMEFDRFLVCLVPEFISNRFFADLVTTSENQTLLIESYFNAQSTYVETYYSLGIIGCYLNYFAFLILLTIVNKIRKICTPFSVVPSTVLTIFFTLSFFYNVFYYTLPTMIVAWCVLHMICKRMFKSQRSVGVAKIQELHCEKRIR